MKKLLTICVLLFFTQAGISAVNKSCQDKLITTEGDTIVCTILNVSKKRVAYLACPSESNNYDNSDHILSRYYISEIITDKRLFLPRERKVKKPKDNTRPPKFMIPFFALGLITMSWMVFLMINWGIF